MGHGFNRFLGALTGVGPRLASMEESLYRQGKMRGELYQEPASRTAMMTDPWYRNLPGFGMTPVPRGGAVGGNYPQLSPGDESIRPYITQIPEGLPPEVMTPERARQAYTEAQTEQQVMENEMYRKWQRGDISLPAGMQPMTMRAGPMTFGYPQIYQVPGDPAQQPFLGGGGGAAGGDGGDTFGGGGRRGGDGGGAGPGLAGNRAQRNNNPGNIKASAFTQNFPGVIGIDPSPAQDGGHFLRFDSPQSGFAGMKTLLKSKYASMPSDAALRRYSGGGYGARDFGVDPGRPIGAYSDQELDELSQRMAQREGYRAPRVIAAQGGTPGAPGPQRPIGEAPAAPGAPGEAPGEEALPTEVAAAPFRRPGAAVEQGPTEAAPPPAPDEGDQGEGEGDEGDVGYPSLAPAEMAPTPPAAPPPAAVVTPAAPPVRTLPGARPPAAPPPPAAAPPPAAQPPARPPGTPPGRYPVQKPTPGLISPRALYETETAAGNSPELQQYLDAHPELRSNEQVLHDREVIRLRQKYWTDYKAAADSTKARLGAEARASLKTLPADAADAVGGYIHAERVLRQISDQYSPEEIDQFTGRWNALAENAKGAYGSFTQSQIGKALGLEESPVNRRYAAYVSLMGQLKSAMFAIGGKQLTGIEKKVVESFIPTGGEIQGATQMVEKGRQFNEDAKSRIDALLTAHGVGSKARAAVLAESERAQRGQHFATGDIPQLFPAYNAAPLEQLGLPPGVTPSTTTSTTLPPAAASPGGAPPAPPAPGDIGPTGPTAPGGAPPAPGAGAEAYPRATETYPPRPKGGIPAKEAAKGSRAYDVAYADRLGLPQLPPEEVGVSPGTEFTRRLVRGVTELPGAVAAHPVRTLAKVGVGVLGAPAKTVGAGVEELSGSRAAGTAAEYATDLALAAGGVRRLASPAIPAAALRRLEPQMAAGVSNVRRIVAAVPRVARGAIPTAEQSAAREVEQLLTRAATNLKPGEQAIYVNRAVAVARNYLQGRGQVSRAIEALGDLGTTQRQLATSFGRRSAIARGAKWAAGLTIPPTVLYQFRDTIKNAWGG